MAAPPERPSDPSSPEGSVPEISTRRLREQSQLDFELEFFGRILERDPLFTDALRVHGNNLAAKGLYARALQVDRRLVRLLPDRAVPWYNLACSYAVLGMTDPAVSALQRALELGYRHLDHLRRDPDLRSLRRDPRFIRLLLRVLTEVAECGMRSERHPAAVRAPHSCTPQFRTFPHSPLEMKHHNWDHVQEATRAVRSRWRGVPQVGLILGTGLGALAEEIVAEATIPYPEIPHFPHSTVQSHKGQFVCGTLGGPDRRRDGGAVPPLRGLLRRAGDVPDPRDEGTRVPLPDRLERGRRAEPLL